MTVAKRGKKWCVLHGHPKKSGSKKDKPKGSIIKCYEGTDAHDKALAMHRAIVISQHKRA